MNENSDSTRVSQSNPQPISGVPMGDQFTSKPSRNSSCLLACVLLLVAFLCVLILGVGGFFGYKYWQGQLQKGTETAASATQAVLSTTTAQEATSLANQRKQTSTSQAATQDALLNSMLATGQAATLQAQSTATAQEQIRQFTATAYAYQTQQAATSIAQTMMPTAVTWEPPASCDDVLSSLQGNSDINLLVPDLSSDRWPVQLCEDFNSPGDWYVADSDSEYGIIKEQVIDGVYRWQINATKGVINYELPPIDQKSFRDFFLAASLRMVNGSEENDYSLIFRTNDQNSRLLSYVFKVNPSYQNFSIQIRTETDTSVLQDWTSSEYIHMGDSWNQLMVLATGSNFAFFINGNTVATITENTYSEGNVGIAANVYNAGDSGLFEYDNILLKAPITR